MNATRRSFVLFVESILPCAARDATAGRSPPASTSRPRPECIEVPADQVSYLITRPDQSPQLVSDAPESGPPLGVLEPVRHDRQAYLVVVSPDRSLRVNGVLSPRLAALRTGDQVQFDDHILHVSMYYRPYLGPPRPEHVGGECPFCRVPIAADITAVYVCASCDAVMHCEGPEKPAENRLECARLATECPSCGDPLYRKAGFAYVPAI